jgi:hypothetical protein
LEKSKVEKKMMKLIYFELSQEECGRGRNTDI